MSMPVVELRQWLQTLHTDSEVAIDEGGLAIVEIDEDGKKTGAYLELGGEPDPNPMVWCKACRSYHVIPEDKEHHSALKCFAPWKS